MFICFIIIHLLLILNENIDYRTTLPHVVICACFDKGMSCGYPENKRCLTLQRSAENVTQACRRYLCIPVPYGGTKPSHCQDTRSLVENGLTLCKCLITLSLTPSYATIQCNKNTVQDFQNSNERGKWVRRIDFSKSRQNDVSSRL